MDEPDEKTNWKLIKLVLIMSLNGLTTGAAIAWSSPSLPKLLGKEGPEANPLSHPISTREESLIASLLAMGSVLTLHFGGFAADRIGRKKTLIITTIPLFLGFAIMTIANEVWHFFVARFLCGVAMGTSETVSPNYMAEICEKHNRGALGTLTGVIISFGIVAMFAFGPHVTISQASLIWMVPLAAFFINFSLYAPESPYYLIAQKRYQEAEESLKQLRPNRSPLLQDELVEIQTTVEKAYANKTDIYHILKDPLSLKKLGITIFLTIFQQFSGATVVLYYSQKIFEEAGGILSPENSSIVIGVAQVVSFFISMFVIDKLGRRFLLYVSGAGTSVMLLIIGAYFQIKISGGAVDHLMWVPIISITVHMLFDSVGFAPVPNTLLGEIFPQHMRAIACTTTIGMNFAVTSLTTYCFPYLLKYLGEAWTFWFFSIFCVNSMIFTYFVVPETKGKSLAAIQEMLDNKRLK